MLFLYDPYFNVRFYLEGIEKINQMEKYEGLVNLLGSPNPFYKNFKKKRIISKLGKYLLSDDMSRKEVLDLYKQIKFEDEVWKELNGFDEEYYISNYGRIKMVYQKSKKERLLCCYQRSKCLITKNGEIMYSTKTNKSGRIVSNSTLIKLKKDGVIKEYHVARLVGFNFLDTKDYTQDDICFVHTNGLFYDNRACNLEVRSREYLGTNVGKHSRAIPVEKYDPITNETIDYYCSVREAGIKNYISYQTVLDFLNGKTKSAAGLYFRKAI